MLDFANIPVESPDEGCGLLAHNCQHFYGNLGSSLGACRNQILGSKILIS